MRNGIAAFLLLLPFLLAGGAAAQSQNPMEQFSDLLLREHAEILTLVSRLETGDPADRERDLSRLQMILAPHMRGEEAAFYPALEQAADAVSLKKAEQQHQAARKAFQSLTGNYGGEREFFRRLRTLKQVLLDHFLLEEEQLLALARQHLSDQQFQRILAELAAFRKGR